MFAKEDTTALLRSNTTLAKKFWIVKIQSALAEAEAALLRLLQKIWITMVPAVLLILTSPTVAKEKRLSYLTITATANNEFKSVCSRKPLHIVPRARMMPRLGSLFVVMESSVMSKRRYRYNVN